MKAELRATTFLENLEADTIGDIVQRLTTEYLHHWPRPIVKHSFSKEVEDEWPEGPWSGTLEDFRVRIRAALTRGRMAHGACQCHWHIQDAFGDQYWWIRVFLFPVPNLRFSADDLGGNIDKDGLHLQESALISMVNEKMVDLAETRSEYVGLMLVIYLYCKLMDRHMIVPSIYIKRNVVEAKAVMNAATALASLLGKPDVDKVQSIRYTSIVESVRRIDDVVKANVDKCKVWIESIGCSVEEWLSN